MTAEEVNISRNCMIDFDGKFGDVERLCVKMVPKNLTNKRLQHRREVFATN
jgi:hypothetical protein